MSLSKSALRELAVDGARNKLLLMERELKVLHAEFPHLFIGNTAPVFVASERRQRADRQAVRVKDPEVILVRYQERLVTEVCVDTLRQRPWSRDERPTDCLTAAELQAAIDRLLSAG
jgi:hypothetical protein